MKNANKEQVNRELFGYIQPGKCWHVAKVHKNQIDGPFHCVNENCNVWWNFTSEVYNPDYFTKDGFFDLWKGMQEKHPQKWKVFLDLYLEESLIDPEILAPKLLEYLKGEK